jgi:thiamine-monophosphate kinase
MCDEKRDDDSDFLKHDSSQQRHSRSEFDFIKLVKERALKRGNVTKDLNSSLITHHSSLLRGIGDDAALIRQSGGRDLVITTDLLIEDVDFRRAWITPQLLGHKALAVSLSDIAAMGAEPRYALLSIGIPQQIWRTDFVEEFYEGFFALADAHRVTLVGGDVSRVPERVVIDSIVVGETTRGRAVLRSGASAGDHIFVTGSLGGAAAGLRLLEAGARLTKSKARSAGKRAVAELLARHLRPEPRVAWGAMLGEQRLATAMIDVSDGLSSDLAHLCEESGAGGRLDAARIPVDPSLMRLREHEFDPLELALNGGEDFELLFTVKPQNLKKLPTEIDGVPVTYLGDMTRQTSLTLVDGSRSCSLTPSGFKHF